MTDDLSARTGGTMNIRQTIAYSAPCYMAEDTARSRFRWGALIDGRHLSFVLTANVGLE
jgi:hypothetical protein